jgi:hypothetical protein
MSNNKTPFIEKNLPSSCWYDPDVLEKVETEVQSRVPGYLIEFEWDSNSDSESESE